MANKFHKNLLGEDLHIARANVGSGSPISVITPGILGEFYFDISGLDLYIAKGLTNVDWELITSGGGGSSIFGSEYDYIEDNSVSTISGTTSYQQKISLSATVLGGKYRLGWNYNWNHDSAANDFLARLQQNDSIDLMEHQQEPKDSAGSFGSTGTNQKHQASGFIELTLIAGSHTFDLDFATSSSSDESSIWNARLEFWRVV